MSIFDLADKLFDGIVPLEVPPDPPAGDAELAERWSRVLDRLETADRIGLQKIQPMQLHQHLANQTLIFNLCGSDGNVIQERLQGCKPIWDFLTDEFGPILIELQAF